MMRRSLSRALLAVVLGALTIGALTMGARAVDVEGFDDPVLDERYRTLVREIRCMKCQNQSIADSPIDVAADLRRQVREMMAAGRSDAEIKDYLASRYGDFILYEPPLKPSTWALWGGPPLLLVFGAVIFARIVRSRASQPIDLDAE